MSKNRGEILAPAGSMDSVTAAVSCGADAVYFGSRDFNARKNASNFSDEDFVNAVKYCHLHGVKVYQTVNTIVYDSELEELKNSLKKACKAGVDALIIQDLAVYEIVKSCCPDMPLHASTQMSVHTLAGAMQLKEMGFERVVLSREMSREQILNIVQNTDIETEVFVHGALCMCVSGQCYLSAMIGQRSGNRGLCAQPCRLPHSADNSRDRYDLSLKDLSLADRLQDLQKIGVTSFKIEGRMKRPEYVAAAVTACRESLDNGKISLDISQKLESVFSRSGFTDGYYTGKKGKEMFGIRQKQDVVSADSKVLSSLSNLYKNEQQNVAVDLLFSLTEEKAVLTASDGDNTVVCESFSLEPAKNLPTDRDSAFKNLSKTGGTPFFVENFAFENPHSMFMPVSAINELRRKVLRLLEEKRSQTVSVNFCDPSFAEPKSRIISDKPKLYMRFRHFCDITEKAIEKADLIVLPIGEISIEIVEKFGDKLVCELPRGKFSNEKAIFEKLCKLKKAGLKTAIVSNIGDILLCKDAGVEAIGGFGLNVSNSLALEGYRKLGLKETVVSFELTLKKVAALKGSLPRGIIAYGHLPLMLTVNCPAANTVGCGKCNKKRFITDRMGKKFPVVCSNECSEILNCQPLYLADKLSDISNCDFMFLYFTVEGRSEIDKIIDNYTQNFEKRENITRGLSYRGSI